MTAEMTLSGMEMSVETQFSDKTKDNFHVDKCTLLTIYDTVVLWDNSM